MQDRSLVSLRPEMGIPNEREAIETDEGHAGRPGSFPVQVMNLSDGRVRWTRPADLPPGQFAAQTRFTAMAVSGASVLLAGNGRLTS